MGISAGVPFNGMGRNEPRVRGWLARLRSKHRKRGGSLPEDTRTERKVNSLGRRTSRDRDLISTSMS